LEQIKLLVFHQQTKAIRSNITYYQILDEKEIFGGYCGGKSDEVINEDIM